MARSVYVSKSGEKFSSKVESKARKILGLPQKPRITSTVVTTTYPRAGAKKVVVEDPNEKLKAKAVKKWYPKGPTSTGIGVGP